MNARWGDDADIGTQQAALDLGGVLAAIGVDRFFAEYWQRRVLTLDIGKADFHRVKTEVGDLDIARLASLSKDGAQAWITNDHIAYCSVPINAGNAAEYYAAGATLYFLNVPLERLTADVAAFLGVPRQRMVASIFLTPPCGGASCHFDMHENFTIQLTGAKLWHVGETPAVPVAAQGYVVGQEPPAFIRPIGTVEEETPLAVDMRPGRLLYVPRGTFHRTEAGVESWSLNLSYSRTMWLDLLTAGLKERLGRTARWRGSVTGLGRACHPAAHKANDFPHLIAELRALLADPNEIELFCQQFLERPDN